MKVLCLLLTVLFSANAELTAPNRALPTHESIHYTGRVLRRDSSTVIFDWPAIHIQTAFTGTSCKALITGNDDAFDVFLDGELIKTVRLGPQDSCRVIAENLTDTLHQLKLVKRFASWGAQVEFHGLLLDKGARLYPPRNRPTMRIELVGGSIMSGFGNQSGEIRCESIVDSSNSSLTYGAFLAERLDAEYHMITVSGKGLIREWASPYRDIAVPFEAFYDRVLRSEPEPTWDFERWVPHLVIVNLGGNDFSTYPHPTKPHFISVYRAFIRKIQARYPNCQIVCISSVKEPLNSYVNEMVAQLQNEGCGQVTHFSYPHVAFSKRGCDWHPNVEAHREIADLLYQHLSDGMRLGNSVTR